MRTNHWLMLGVVLSTSLFAQQSANPPAAPTNAAPVFPPPSPLPKATLAKINRMNPIFDGKTLDGWKASVKGTNAADITKAWAVKDGAMVSLGEGRGVVRVADDLIIGVGFNNLLSRLVLRPGRHFHLITAAPSPTVIA